eukprot:CAMPEP_0116976754 /NCGR_PEP_ID=MMETSP0467-20121206/56703_1 /TAXON_ID=283647 /ORGANISM="Mesodinium pulex, Strain SPMC105" /LENGTH=53 /DNA_ID=CAMNT_0004669651 /DNA_START=47 /DNA_END=205 /DNA_ORIENTATION=-
MGEVVAHGAMTPFGPALATPRHWQDHQSLNTRVTCFPAPVVFPRNPAALRRAW